MKRFKKILSIMLTLAMAIVMTVPAFAATGVGGTDKGAITINNPQKGKTYTVYRIFDLESYDTGSGAYSYKVNSAWSNFFTGSGAGLSYVTVSTNEYVTWNENADTKAFAEAAINFAKKNNVGNQGTHTVGDSEETYTFTNLELGYYLVDSNLGTLCSLGTTSSNATINEKNAEPTIGKTVSESTASIGQVIHYVISINAEPGAESYQVRDKMSTGLSFNDDIVVTKKSGTAQETTVASSNYTNLNETGYTFGISFNQDFCDTLVEGDTLFIRYTATVNKDAITVDKLTNDAVLNYGNNGEFSVSSNGGTPTETETFEISLNKTNGSTTITGAEFKLFDALTGGNEIPVVSENGTDGEVYYRVAEKDETGTTIKAGNVKIKGLGAGKYYLEETKAPEGYNKLSAREEVEIVNADVQKTIVNQTGSLLPSTGGIGTTIFYIIGGILVVGAAVLLVTKKRMSKEA